MTEGTVPVMIRFSVREDLKSYKVRIKAKNYSEAIDQLIKHDEEKKAEA